VDTELTSHNTDEVLDVINAARTTPSRCSPQDIAENIAFMVTRPRRSSIAELWAMPTLQA
jgi:NADP-dependent 3-hydroxy acid dehydrogenase YdfG